MLRMTGIGAPPSLPRLTAKRASPTLQWPLAVGGVTIGPAAMAGGDVLIEDGKHAGALPRPRVARRLLPRQPRVTSLVLRAIHTIHQALMRPIPLERSRFTGGKPGSTARIGPGFSPGKLGGGAGLSQLNGSEH